MKKSCVLQFLASVLLIGIVFFAARSLTRHEPRSTPKVIGVVDKKNAIEGVMHGGLQETRHEIRKARAAVSTSGRKLNEPIWMKLDAERTKYEARFSKDFSVGFGRGMWLNSKQVRFWTDLLASDDPCLVNYAIDVIEGSTWERAGVLRDSKGSKATDRHLYSREDWESHQIFNTLLGARGVLSGARSGTPLRSSLAGGDTNDALILKDASMILKVFVPRLRDPDPSKSAIAKSVINLFTFDIFRDLPLEWWEAGSPLDEVK